MSRDGIEGILSDEIWRHINGEELKRRWRLSDKERAKSPNQFCELVSLLAIQGDPFPMRAWFMEQWEEGHQTKEPNTSIYSPHYVPAILTALTGSDSQLRGDARRWWMDHLYFLSLGEGPKRGEVHVPGSRTFGHDESQDAMFSMGRYGEKKKWQKRWADTPNRDAGAAHRLFGKLPDYEPPSRPPKMKDTLVWYRTERGWCYYFQKGLRGCWSDACYGVSQVDDQIHHLAIREEGENSRLMMAGPGGDPPKRGKVTRRDGRLHAAAYYRVKHEGGQTLWMKSIPTPPGPPLEEMIA